MRALVLLHERQLGAGEPALGIEKMRIVAEPRGATRRVDDRAVPSAFGEDRLGIVRVAQQSQHAIIMRAAIGDPGEIGDELVVIAPVRARLAGVTRRLHAWRAVKRRDAHARIVGQRGQSSEAARMPRLGQRVLDESRVRLVGFRYSERGLRDDIDVERSQQPAEFAQLAFVGGGEDDATQGRIHSAAPVRGAPRANKFAPTESCVADWIFIC